MTFFRSARRIHVLIFMSVLALFCRADIPEDPQPSPPTTTFDQNPSVSLPLPEVPSELISPRDRATYILSHYWAALDTISPLGQDRRVLIERSFADFIQLFPIVDSLMCQQAVDMMFDRFEKIPGGLDMIMDVSFKYLYEPESPFYNEDTFIMVLRRELESNKLSSLEKQRPSFLLECALKNRPGDIAADFNFLTADGTEMSLHGFVSPKTILIFYDPDCHHCEEVIDGLSKSEGLNELIDDGLVKVLAIYPFDDRQAWEENAVDLPGYWTVGINGGDIDDDQLYVFPSFPALYLLDENKQVILKDATPVEIFKRL